MARNKKVEILSNGQEVLHPITDGDCVIFSDGQTLTQKLSEDDSVKYTPEVTNSSPMFKVGEGNTVDYSANVLDGAYERAVLTGQTYTNNIQEPSADEVTLPTPFTTYERTQHNTLTSSTEGTLGINLVGQSYVNALQHDSEEEYVVLGESLEFQEKKVEYTNEGQIKSAMLKGQTLVNLQKVNRVEDVSTQSYKDTWQTVITKEKSYNMWRTGDVSLFKPNTKYLCIMEVKENTFTLPTSLIIGHDECIFGYNETIYPTSKTEFQPKETGRKIAILTTKANFDGVMCSQRFATNMDNVTQGEKISFRMMFIEYQEGMENWDIPYFEGMQSVTVSTKLENKLGTFSGTVSTAKTGKTFTTTDGVSRSLYLYSTQTASTNPINLKPKTKYLIQFTISNLVLDGLSMVSLIWSDSTLETGNCLFGENTGIKISANGTYRTILTTTDLITTSSFVVKGYVGDWENSSSSLRSLTISNIMCIEYQNGMENWDLPYFEDYQVMKPVQVKSVNKNLCPVNKNDFYNIHFKAGAEFILSTKDGVASQGGNIVFKDIDGNDMWMGIDAGTTSKKYTLSKDAYSIHNFLQSPDVISYQLEQSSTATTYVPHQSKTTYSWDEVILRKIGDVEDTLDLTTGEWVQRIGEVVLDGSDDEIWYPSGLNQNLIDAGHKNIVFYYNQQNNGTIPNLKIMPYDSMGNIICDKLQSVIHKDQLDTSSKDCSSICGGSTATEIRIAIPVENSTAQQDSATCKEWLKANPIRVQYELATPKIHKVNLSRPNLQVYDDITHVHTKCLDGTLIPNIYLPAEVSYPVGVESETVYNVCVNHEVSSSNPLVCNVGGSTFTVTQPRTLITVPQGTKTISFSGKDNVISDVMMIKNSSLLTRDLPHFNGVSSVQLGKTITNLCNTNAFKAGNSNSTLTWNKDYVHVNVSNTTGSCVFTFELTKQLENGKKYFVYAKNNLGGTADVASFRRVYNGSLSYARQQTHIENNWCIVEVDQQDNPYTHLCVGCHHNIPLGTEFDIYYPIICEYEPGMENWDWESIGYFTGTKNIGNEFMRVQNKNLFVKYYDKININNIKNLSIRTDNTVGATRMALRFYDKNLQPILNSNAISCNKQFYHVDNNNKWVLSSDRTQVLINNISILDNNIAFMTIEKLSSNIEYINVQLEESSTATTYTAHKHNGLYITKDQPINLTWEQGRINPSGVGDSYTNAINNAVSYGVRNKGLLNLKPNTTYRLSLGDTTTYKWHIALFDNWDCVLQANNLFGLSGDWSTAPETFITTTKDYHKIGINIQRQDSGSLSASTVIPCRLEEVEEIKLRSASGKYDELDITRGKYIQRVGELYVDGKNIASNNIGKVGDTYQPTDTTLNTYDIKCPGAILSARVHINHFAPRNGATESTGISYESAAIHSANQSCRITISKSKASTLEEFKAWLSKNPLTIVYALNDNSEIEHDIVFIGNKNESGTEITKPNGIFTLPALYTEQTHIDLTNNGIMPKVQSRDYIEYPIISGMHRTYTLQHNSIGSSDLTIDLCGRTQTIPYSSPKSLVYSDNEGYVYGRLRISGAGNKISKVMLLDGGYMDRDIPYIEGMKNAVNPIVKNVGKNLYHNSNSYIFNDGVYIGTKEYHKKPTFILQRNTNYTMTFESSSNDGRIYGYNDGVFIGYLGGNSSGGKTVTFNTGNCNGISFYRQVTSGLTLDYKITLSEVQTTDEYKENICYVDCGEIRLTPDMFEQGSIRNVAAHVGLPYADDKVDSTTRIRTKDLIELDVNEQYVFLGDPNYCYSIHFHDRDGLKVTYNGIYELAWKGNIPFTPPTDAPMAAIFIRKENQGNITPSELQHINVQLVKVSEIKPLRSLPNEVYDEIDLETGKYIQRVGEITFNGSESWIQGYQSWENKNTFYTNGITYSDGNIKVRKGENGSGQAYDDSVRCGELQRTYMQRIANNETYGVCSYFYLGYQRIFVRVPNITTSDELKLWLSQNPITVQYELETPIVKDIVIHNYPHSYKGGHVLIENGDPNTPIPAQITYRAVTNRSGQIQQHTEQVEKQEREINELEMLILANISNQTR